MREELESRDVAAEELCVEDERQLHTVEATAGEDGALPDELCFRVERRVETLRQPRAHHPLGARVQRPQIIRVERRGDVPLAPVVALARGPELHSTRHAAVRAAAALAHALAVAAVGSLPRVAEVVRLQV